MHCLRTTRVPDCRKVVLLKFVCICAMCVYIFAVNLLLFTSVYFSCNYWYLIVTARLSLLCILYLFYLYATLHLSPPLLALTHPSHPHYTFTHQQSCTPCAYVYLLLCLLPWFYCFTTRGHSRWESHKFLCCNCQMIPLSTKHNSFTINTFVKQYFMFAIYCCCSFCLTLLYFIAVLHLPDCDLQHAGTLAGNLTIPLLQLANDTTLKTKHNYFTIIYN